jgi:hypothetical protein
MSRIVGAIEVLRANRFLETPESVRAFDGALAQLPERIDARSIRELYDLFTDRAEFFEAMWGLLHYVEAQPTEEYLEAYISALPDMMADAREWADTLLCRLMNDDSTRALLVQRLHDAPAPSLAAARSLLLDIAAATNVPVSEHASEVLREIGLVNQVR